MRLVSTQAAVVGYLALSAAALPAQQGRGEPQPARQGWLGSLSAGNAQARQSGKPLMVVLRCEP